MSLSLIWQSTDINKHIFIYFLQSSSVMVSDLRHNMAGTANYIYLQWCVWKPKWSFWDHWEASTAALRCQVAKQGYSHFPCLHTSLSGGLFRIYFWHISLSLSLSLSLCFYCCPLMFDPLWKTQPGMSYCFWYSQTKSLTIYRTLTPNKNTFLQIVILSIINNRPRKRTELGCFDLMYYVGTLS